MHLIRGLVSAIQTVITVQPIQVILELAIWNQTCKSMLILSLHLSSYTHACTIETFSPAHLQVIIPTLAGVILSNT